MGMTAYEQAEAYILNIPKFAGKHSLQDTKALLRAAVKKQDNKKIIHVAGTNGKGSVCAYLRDILWESGCRAGFFSSPHLETMRERIAIGNHMISEEDFVLVFQKVRETIDKIKKEVSHPSFFEFLFLMAMVYFEEKDVEYVILETGLGGRLDATNIFPAPRVCVITSIGYDHMQYLGSRIEEIAAEKAGIMKQGVPVVFLEQAENVTAVLMDYAKKTGSPAVVIKKTDISDVNIHNKSIDFSFHSGYYKYVSLSLNTKAVYQAENAALAAKAAELLKEERITIENIRNGLFKSHWPGRMEEIASGVYLDGAHNEDGIRAFLQTAGQDGCKGRRFLLFGVVADKKYDKMIELLAKAGLFEQAAITALDSDRSVTIDKLKEICRQYRQISCSFYEEAEAAYQSLLEHKKKEDMIYIAGSLYLAGQIKTLIRRSPND